MWNNNVETYLNDYIVFYLFSRQASIKSTCHGMVLTDQLYIPGKIRNSSAESIRATDSAWQGALRIAGNNRHRLEFEVYSKLWSITPPRYNDILDVTLFPKLIAASCKWVEYFTT